MKSPQETKKSTPAKSQDKPLLARRAIIKGAAGTLPTILTLQSGAALARSSNLIGSSSSPKDEAGRTLCLDLRFVDSYDGVKADVGSYGHVQKITERDYYRESNRSTPLTEEDMCVDGLTGWYQETGWNPADVHQGMLISSNAYNSLAGIMDVTEI